MQLKNSIFVAALAVAATPALAHTGTHSVSGFAAGFLHPLGGFDHMLAMVGAGLFAALLGRSALVVVPASFVLMMMTGGAIGMAGFQIPAVEALIAASVVAVGVVVALGWPWPRSAAATLVGFFAVFHGYAHGIEIPIGADAFPYILGFALASAALHSFGVILSRMTSSYRNAAKSIGAAITFAGLVLAFAL
ncbi:HupE/UreJ family protein [Microvirga sp. BT689]|uniref:HupE/UreJ family protein n=1 Tax=Microvirga arvi TaxID=2778731 RepID=UPI00194FFB60|nr:HupE/UreJ family protein [Microvirga arvi]MBM6580671.1 HupE/UreJ family protein [Microvirga arvi]